MDEAMRYRFATFAALLLLFAVAGLLSLPVLQRCCADPPLPAGWPNPPNGSLLNSLLFMDMVPRLAALAVAAGTASLLGLAGIYGLTAKAERQERRGSSARYIGALRVIAAAFVLGILYLYSLFVSGYFQLGWFNLGWIIGLPVLLAALTGRTEFERRWGGLCLIIPAFLAEMALMIALGIDPY